MLKNLIQKLKDIANTRNIPFDPSVFGDPLALQTSWTPAKKGGANFCTHKLVKINPERIEFQASLGAKAFYFLFIIIGFGIMTGFSASIIMSGNSSFKPEVLIPVLFGLVFTIAGCCMFYFGTTPLVFDKYKRAFWKGRSKNDKIMFDRNAFKHYVEFDRIHSLQLIKEYCRNNKSSYYSYELNLVLENTERINVIDHGNPVKLKEDASILAGFLGKPVWDAI